MQVNTKFNIGDIVQDMNEINKIFIITSIGIAPEEIYYYGPGYSIRKEKELILIKAAEDKTDAHPQS